MPGWPLRSGQGSLLNRKSGGNRPMNLDEAEEKFVAEKLAKWERSLVIISLPHCAAFGAFLGRYEISKDPESGLQ
jgi:uncharacterized protein YceK